MNDHGVNFVKMNFLDDSASIDTKFTFKTYLKHLKINGKILSVPKNPYKILVFGLSPHTANNNKNFKFFYNIINGIILAFKCAIIR